MSKVNKQYQLLACLFVCHQLFIGSVLGWDQRIFNASDGESYGYIEKQKWFGIDDLTYYRVKVRNPRPDHLLRIAVQWVHNNAEYSSVMFTDLKAASRKELQAKVDVRRGQDIGEQSLFDEDQYLIILSGISAKSSRYLTYEQAQKYKVVSYRETEDPGIFELVFSRQGHEPYGAAKVWLNYIDYSYSDCALKDTHCLATGRVQLQFQSNQYSNVQETRDFLDIPLFDGLYFAIMISSWFWLFGWPVQFLLTAAVNLYLSINALLSMYKTLLYFESQGAGTDTDGFTKWYLLATVVNWIIAPTLISALMFVNAVVPIFGGLVNWILYEGIRFSLYSDIDNPIEALF